MTVPLSLPPVGRMIRADTDNIIFTICVNNNNTKVYRNHSVIEFQFNLNLFCLNVTCIIYLFLTYKTMQLYASLSKSWLRSCLYTYNILYICNGFDRTIITKNKSNIVSRNNLVLFIIGDQLSFTFTSKSCTSI